MSFFEIIAECSIALAGFGAVHAVLRGAKSPRGHFRAWTVVAQGALSFFLCTLPMILALTSLSDELMWRSVSAVGLVCTSASVYTIFAFDSRMTQIGHPPQSKLSIRIAKLFSVASLLTMLVNLVGWPWASGPFLYAASLIFVLITGLTALLHSFLLPVLLDLREGSIVSPEELHSNSKNDETIY